LLLVGPIEIAPITKPDLSHLSLLMHRYSDRPMDFADATLVHVAEREGLKTILTIDHDDFETYRIGRNAKFRILPARTR
jgi:predicted nucleic acid-binding protein